MKVNQTLAIWTLAFGTLYWACKPITINKAGEEFRPAGQVLFSAEFPSGSVGAVSALDNRGLRWELALKDDNNNDALPITFRTWWYVRVDNTPSDPLQLEFTRLGFNNAFVPVYSYDQKKWQHFQDSEVKFQAGCKPVEDPSSCRVIIHKRFEKSTVWIARSFPYTTKDMADFLTSIRTSAHLSVKELGHSPSLQKPIHLLTINDAQQAAQKQTVWIHARIHAAEVGSSFALEGLIKGILREDELGKSLRKKYIFKIVPMLNPDGVDLGNYRTNASSVEMEREWRYAHSSPYLLPDTPIEIRLANAEMVPLLEDDIHPVVLALNLHSSNSEPNTAAFLFPHFGATAAYDPDQQALWQTQIDFITSLAQNYNGRIQPSPAEGGSNFLNSPFVETWWWNHKRQLVNAITVETT